jgi:hypothetical protein
VKGLVDCVNVVPLMLNPYLPPPYGVPPDAVAVIVVVPPLHSMAGAVAAAMSAGGVGPITTVVVFVHPFASLTVMV